MKNVKPVLKKKVSARKKTQESCHAHVEVQHPSHQKDKKRLNKIKGQLDGIDRMIDDNRYCLDIIYQIRAATSALKSFEKEIMQTHIKSCVKTAIESKNQFESQEKIEEIMNFF